MPNKAKQLKAVSDKGIKATDTAITGFRRGLEKIAKQWRGRVIDLVASGDKAALADIQYVSTQVQGQLNSLGYTDLLNRFVSRYGDAKQRAEQALKTLDIEVPRLAGLDEKALYALRTADYTYLKDIGESAARQVAQKVVLNTLAGEPRSRIIEDVEKVLDGKFKSFAASYADTALVSYDRRVNFDLWVKAGVKQFIFRGPKDIKNRPFCASHVGQVFTVKQIEGMDNKVGPMPVKYFGGGWGCRHVWSPDAQD